VWVCYRDIGCFMVFSRKLSEFHRSNQAPVDRRLDKASHRVNRFPGDKC